MMDSKIQFFDKSNILNVRELIEEKLAELKEFGLIFKLGNICYEDEFFRSKITCNIENSENEYERTYKQHWFGKQNPDAIGKMITVDNNIFKFIGFKPRARKNIAIIEKKNGSQYRIDFNYIERQLLKSVGAFEELI